VKPTSLLLLALLIPSVVAAATKSWTGSVNGNWSNGANWADGTPAAAGDDLSFGNTALTHQLIDDLPAGTVFRSLSFAGPYDLGGNALALTRGMSASGGSGVVVHVPVTLAGAQTWFGSIALTTAAPLDLATFTLTLTQFAGPIDSVISGTGGIIVESDVAFTAANTFTGPTIVRTSSGVMRCACVLPGAVTAADLGTFVFEAGAQIGSATAAGGIIAAGDNAASAVDLFLDTASVFSVRSDSPARSPLTVIGSVSLDDARLDFLPSYTPAVGTVITLIDNLGSDAVAGQFAGLPEGARYKWSASGPTARISYAGGSGNDVTLTIIPEQIATTTILTVTPNPTKPGDQTTVIATVTGADVAPTGIVTFSDGTTILTSQFLRSGAAVALVGPLSPGVHSITAVYQPDTDAYAASTSDPVQLIVRAPPIATTTTISATPDQIRRGDAVTMTATVTSASGTPDGTILFGDSVTGLLATVPLTNGSASFTTTQLAAGTHTLHATFAPSSSEFAFSTSNLVDVTVAEVPGKRRAVRP
jgi:hypothetical protein